ncbi:hypothetical protein INS49_004505 [Diaporthe citri]|uniref:uncharacterized protein n=1 Tax=Diaporthe citri TaxID=83186 RepID=UPI001C80A811|nr:uncharacterized protein INS49_004505 [Diaporthe citri]KAG6354488.1 hypothetical protein INS49_004505 [Diaporthe citri]
MLSSHDVERSSNKCCILLDFERDVTPDLLTQTFPDTVNVVLIMGICYVWIDSLCIIHDSPIDWAEATLMGDVYQDTLVTIIADAVKDVFAVLSFVDGRSAWCQREPLAKVSGLFVRRF